MENLEVMVILFIIVVLGYALCKLGYMGDKFDQKLSSIVLTSSLRHPKILIKEFSYFLMPCHQHGLRINLLV